MKKLMALAALAVIALSPAAQAEEHTATTATTTTTEATKTEATTAVEAKEATLKDGTKVSIEGDSVFVVAADGTKTPAPDAEHELADGTKVKTVSGKIVK